MQIDISILSIILPILSVAFAAAIAFINIYYNFLRGAKLRAEHLPPRFTLEVNSGSEVMFLFQIDLIVVNHGGKAGVVKRIVMALNDKLFFDPRIGSIDISNETPKGIKPEEATSFHISKRVHLKGRREIEEYLDEENEVKIEVYYIWKGNRKDKLYSKVYRFDEIEVKDRGEFFSF